MAYSTTCYQSDMKNGSCRNYTYIHSLTLLSIALPFFLTASRATLWRPVVRAESLIPECLPDPASLTCATIRATCSQPPRHQFKTSFIGERKRTNPCEQMMIYMSETDRCPLKYMKRTKTADISSTFLKKKFE